MAELACNPVLSEHGGVGYLPTASAEDSCYITMRQCQIAVVIIGRRYGHISANGLSVTHNEFRAARTHNVPVFTLVDRDVLAFKRVFDINAPSASPAFPGMDNAAKTFGFIQEISDSPINNGLLTYTSASDARFTLKTQLAHFTGELLRRSADPLTSDVRDVLAELKTLRHEIGRTAPGDRTDTFLRAVRLLLEDRYERYLSLVHVLFGPIDEAIPAIANAHQFDNVVEAATGQPPQVRDLSTDFYPSGERDYDYKSVFGAYIPDAASNDESGREILIYTVTHATRAVVMTKTTLKYFGNLHRSLLRDIQKPHLSRSAT